MLYSYTTLLDVQKWMGNIKNAKPVVKLRDLISNTNKKLEINNLKNTITDKSVFPEVLPGCFD